MKLFKNLLSIYKERFTITKNLLTLKNQIYKGYKMYKLPSCLNCRWIQ